MKKILMILALATLLISCSDDPNEPKDELVLSIIPQTSQIAIGEEVLLEIAVEGVLDLFVATFELTYDSDLLQIDNDSFSEGSIWNDEVISFTQLDEGVYSISIGLEQTDDYDGVSGFGVLCGFSIEAIQIGNVDFIIENLNMMDENANPISGFDNVQIENCSITIE
ncbi:MAG: cohesin domain-containing protein [Candidatus Cloacimonetes bacterium]|nr:cohesin domain-containing protein [Candidatus Cloacimonadota bacterium]MCF7814896.1 cohesin domain-containing protein [Candidatus Cloacimonadota bacterium]MCF7869309.1 cohesin domain-containing protein [Candidatus Cloacimonadota bacterium]MCF7884611.1 cohesin domain-containing protein [Candidatus Cloacimonadota bacterium]